MRQIKFRAWDKERNQFVPQGDIVFSDYGNTYFEVHPNDLSYYGDSCNNGEPQRGRFELSQYTGLKDKNGKEIYEGDILAFESRHEKHDGKIFNNVVEYFVGGVSCGFRMRNKRCCVQLNKNRMYRATVIGNIYENPDLLK